jgi:uncharacterized protein YdhG (YjbR/CyaY superfamily)
MNNSYEIDLYISGFPESTREKLELLREIIKKNAPGATEVISYQMPAFKLNGILVYYAGYRNHIGFYPTGSGIKAFEPVLSGYKWSRGTIQFPLDKPLPLELISEIVRYRVSENLSKPGLKKK